MRSPPMPTLRTVASTPPRRNARSTRAAKVSSATTPGRTALVIEAPRVTMRRGSAGSSARSGRDQWMRATKVDPSARAAAVGLLGCGVMAGLGAAINTGNVGRGSTVAVIGCGGVGAAAIAGAALAGAARIIAVDIDDRKLELAKQFGATHTVNSRNTDPVEAIREATEGFGADVVIEAIGRPDTYEQAFFARDLAGTVVLVGVPSPDMRIDLPLVEFFGRGGALKSSWYGDCLPSRDFPMLIDLYLQGRLPLDQFVTEKIGVGDVEAAFDKMHHGDVLRSVVVFDK